MSSVLPPSEKRGPRSSHSREGPGFGRPGSAAAGGGGEQQRILLCAPSGEDLSCRLCFPWPFLTDLPENNEVLLQVDGWCL